MLIFNVLLTDNNFVPDFKLYSNLDIAEAQKFCILLYVHLLLLLCVVLDNCCRSDKVITVITLNIGTPRPATVVVFNINSLILH